MARKPSLQQVYNLLLETYGRRIADAFLKAIQDIARRAELGRMVAAIQAGNIGEAMAALHLDEAAYSDLVTVINQAFQDGGNMGADALPQRTPEGAALVIRFDGRNLRAEQWLREESSRLVTGLVEEQRETVRAQLQQGMSRGDNPRSVALEIVGRIDTDGRRTGGILGLSTPQQEYLASAREELASGDPARLRNYLKRERRDKRYDRAVQTALKDGKPVPQEQAREALRSYSNRLLKLRGDMIARTEALASLNAAQHEALLQAVERGQLPESAVRRIWKSAGDLRVRHTHAALHGETVGLREPFLAPSGARLMFPGDRSLAAPGSETINCRCIVQPRIDWFANLRS